MIIEELSFCGDVDSLFFPLMGEPSPFILESPPAGENKDISRFSFSGCGPFLSFEARGDEISLTRGNEIERLKGDPLSMLQNLLSKYRSEAHPVFPFAGGAVGYIGYEAGEGLESLPPRKGDVFSLPDISFAFYDLVLAVDHLEKRSFLISTGFPEHGAKSDKRCRERLDYFKGLLLRGANCVERAPYLTGPLSSSYSKPSYLEAVHKIKAYIEEGDIYQANLSQRFTGDFKGSAYELYRQMQEVNPVSFAAYLQFPGISIVSNSPERFLSLRKGRLETRPIKGTIARGADGMADADAARRLKSSRKDGAEHLMIVDLERNDLGRVCRFGSVQVEDLKRIETYSNLHHMVSTVSGRVKDGTGPIDCIRAAFPGGSITGAPKVRAMEIINEVEPVPRWVYTGSIGYIGFDGGMDMNIAIRTAFISGEKICFSVGGGIVADSDPLAEYEETMLKSEVFRNIVSKQRC